MKRNYFNWSTLLLITLMSGLVFTACEEESEPDRSSAKEITTFTFGGLNPAVAGTIDGSDITVTVPSGTDVTSLSPTVVVSPEATVSPASGTAQDFTSPVTYTVTAEDGSTTTYTVTVNVTPEQSGEAEIITFVLGELDPPVDGDIDEDNNITATVPARTDLTALVPTIVISEDAAIDPASGAAQDFTEPVTYTVTAEDGTTQEYAVTITPAASVQVNAVWEKNLNAGGLPDFFTANNEREIAAYGDFVYVQTNNDKIRILNRTTGEEIDSEDFLDGIENFEGGNIFANLLGMDVDDAGNVIASTGALANGDFRVYRWDENSTQELLFEGNYPARLGDNITVVGDVNDAAIIYAPGVGTDQIYRFTILNGELSGEPTTITTPTPIGNAADVNPINGEDGNNLIATGTGFANIVELEVDGGTSTTVHQLPNSLKETADSTIFDALSAIAFEVNGRNVLAAASTNYNGDSMIGTLYFVDYTDGWDEITEEDITAIPFTPADNELETNFNATGGLDVIVSEDGNEATVYGLITNFGIGAYRVTFE